MTDIRGGIVLVKEQAIGDVNGTNVLFNTSNRYISNTLRVELNGQKLLSGSDFFETTDNGFTMAEPPMNSLGYVDRVVVEYERK